MVELKEGCGDIGEDEEDEWGKEDKEDGKTERRGDDEGFFGWGGMNIA